MNPSVFAHAPLLNAEEFCLIEDSECLSSGELEKWLNFRFGHLISISSESNIFSIWLWWLEHGLKSFDLVELKGNIIDNFGSLLAILKLFSLSEIIEWRSHEVKIAVFAQLKVVLIEFRVHHYTHVSLIM